MLPPSVKSTQRSSTNSSGCGSLVVGTIVSTSKNLIRCTVQPLEQPQRVCHQIPRSFEWPALLQCPGILDLEPSPGSFVVRLDLLGGFGTLSLCEHLCVLAFILESWTSTHFGSGTILSIFPAQLLSKRSGQDVEKSHRKQPSLQAITAHSGPRPAAADVDLWWLGR